MVFCQSEIRMIATGAFNIFLLVPRLQLILYIVLLIKIHAVLSVVGSGSGMTLSVTVCHTVHKCSV